MRELDSMELTQVSGGEATAEGYLKSCTGGAVAGAMGAAATGAGLAVLPKAAFAGCLISMASYGISELF
jgi:folate-dependent tRNA-U54 methylase TrmFO/GidA